MTHLLVVGAGLAGLSAVHFALQLGARVTLVSEGRGGLSLSHGGIDLLRPAFSGSSFASLHRLHPYRLLGIQAVLQAVDELITLLDRAGLTLGGDPARPWCLPTATGAVRLSALAPNAQHPGDLSLPAPMLLATLESFRDFDGALARRGLQSAGPPVSAISLPLPDLPHGRDLYAADLARLFDDDAWRSRLIDSWQGRIPPGHRLGLPAVLGLRRSAHVLHDLNGALGMPVFEVPCLPPSVPGLRMERALRQAALSNGARVIEGSAASGRTSRSRYARGVDIHTAGGPRQIDADAVILASGGPLHGGLRFEASGAVVEPIFGLPVVHVPERKAWLAGHPFGPHAYARFGVQVGADMRPLGPDGRRLYDNLFAVGGLVAHADRIAEGSRHGIDLGTARRAVEGALA